MTFTLIFKGIYANLSYMLCFEPSPIWRKQNDEWMIVLDRTSPHYQLGGLRKLLNHEKDLIQHKECIVVIQHEGHGTYDDLRNLELDLKSEEVHYQFVSFQH